MAKQKVAPATKKVRQKNMYISRSFDTHKFVKSFTAAGLKEEQAEAIVTAIVESRDHDLSKLATKEQLEYIKVQLDTFKDELKLMSTKEELEAVKVQIDTFKISTKEQFEEIKDELKLMATKEQLETFKISTKEQFEAVKDELKLMATKEQLETVRIQLDTKIDSSIAKLEASILKWFIATAITMTGIIIASAKFIH